MIRPITCVFMLMAAGSGLYVYQSKHQAQLETREIRKLLADADAARKDTGLLVAEYARENDPDRLGDFAKRFLPDLRPTEPTQFTTLADLDSRLPPVGAQPPAQAPLEPDVPFQTPHIAAQPDAGVGAADVPARELYGPPAPDAPVPMPPVGKPVATAPALVSKADPKPDVARPAQLAGIGRPAETALRPSEPAARSAPAHVAARREWSPAPAPATTTAQLVASLHAPPQTGYLAPIQRFQPVQMAPPPMVGSALGMARTMPQSEMYYANSVNGPGGGRN